MIKPLEKCIDTAYNTVDERSKKAQQDASEIINYAAKQEALRISEYQKEREEMLVGFHEDPSTLKLGEMDEALWAITYSGFKVAQQAKIDEEARIERDRIEKEATDALRTSRLDQLAPTLTSYSKLYSGAEHDLGLLDEAEFSEIYVACKVDSEAEVARLAEIEAENKRLTDLAEAEKLVKEEATKRQTSFFEFNMQVSFEACSEMTAEEYKTKYDKARVDFKIEADKIYAEKVATDNKAKEVTRLAKIESDKQAKILADTQAANAKLLAENKAKADAIAKVEADKVQAAKELAKASVTVKMTAWLDEVQIRRVDTNTIKDPKIKQVTNSILNAFDSFRNLALNEIKTL